MGQTTETVSGIIDRFIYKNPENGFSVFVLQITQQKTTTVCGYFPNIQPGQQVQLTGKWVMHPKFGKQFEAQEATSEIPTSTLGLKKYLGSGLIKGIGPVYAEKLVQYFGTEVLEVIDKEPDRLKEVPGIGKKRIEKIALAWQDQKEISKIMVFLQDKGISTTYAVKIFKKYGQESRAVLQENPYRLSDDIWGIGFKIADKIAQNMGIAFNSIKRINAGIIYLITQELNAGHLYAQVDQIKQKAASLLELEDQDLQKITHSLHDLYNQDRIKLITHNEQHFITLSQYYFSEKGVAHKTMQLLKQPILKEVDLQAAYDFLRNSSDKLVLNTKQIEGIITCLENKISIITGGPGTGKTTLVKKLLTVLDQQKLTYRLAAPTGKAAKRIMQSTGCHAVTIHRLLEFDALSHGFIKNEQNALQLDVLIIDESSMIDIFLAHSILKALPYHARIIFIGDIDQLPSVGAGNFLQDLLQSKSIASVRLTEIFRQAQDSMIVVNAHKINQGEFPQFDAKSKKDFIFIKEQDPVNVQQHLQQLFKKRLLHYGANPKNAMVLVPMNRGVVGTQKINYDLQQIMNPFNNEKVITRQGISYKIDDRVMQIRNNYDKSVFNGDTGVIKDIDPEDRLLSVQFDDRLVEYEAYQIDELVLAYAISIHKSQGSEFDTVIIPIFMQHFTLLQRNLIYTAITRAKKLCILIGQPKAIAIGIKNNKGTKRTTFLKEFITSDLTCR